MRSSHCPVPSLALTGAVLPLAYNRTVRRTLAVVTVVALALSAAIVVAQRDRFADLSQR